MKEKSRRFPVLPGARRLFSFPVREAQPPHTGSAYYSGRQPACTRAVSFT